jgi:thiol:disulfide interchange protein DsbD
MNIINRIIIIVLIVSPICFALPLYSEPSPVDEITAYNASGKIIVSQGKTAAAVIAIEIPEGSYIYANPKGKGIGRATEAVSEAARFIKSWEVRYPSGEIYQAKGDPDPVNVYRKIVRIPVLFNVTKDAYGDYTLKINMTILMCSSDACIPADRSVEIPVKVKRGRIDSTTVMMNNLGEFLTLKKNIIAVDSKNINQSSNVLTADEDGIPGNIIFTPQYPEGEVAGIIKAVIFGLIAGFILNFMPCVLPVVSLKIMSFVMNAGEKKRIIVIQGLLFSAGIIASFLVLAGLAAFFGHKWGTLFQDTGFIIVMTSFIFAMALSLFGVFTFNVPLAAGRAVSRTRGIYTDAFVKGGVATLLATPCSGPFLGGTLAWALTMPPHIIFIIFLSIGIGMAFPYMLLAVNPSFIRILPKPGAWMNQFEVAMGFLLMFTAVYLIGILDDSARMGLVLFLLFLAIGLWQYGSFGSIDKERWKRILSFVILISIGVLGYTLSFKFFFTERIFPHERISFNAERILKNRDNGIITVVEFTADWCPNCSLVEKIALEKDEVQKLFARDDVEFMVADITQKNLLAESLMNRLGSKSIPLLAVFPPGEGFSSPLCLRDIYSSVDVSAAVNKAEEFIIKK